MDAIEVSGMSKQCARSVLRDLLMLVFGGNSIDSRSLVSLDMSLSFEIL